MHIHMYTYIHMYIRLASLARRDGAAATGTAVQLQKRLVLALRDEQETNIKFMISRMSKINEVTY